MCKLSHRFVRKVIRLILVTCLGGLLPSAAVAQTIVWTDDNARKIQRKEVSGGAVATIVQFPSQELAEQIHHDPITAKLYYRFFPAVGTPVFQRAKLDGSEPENVPTPSVGNFALSVESRKLYWISGASLNVLNRAALNGAEAKSHTYPTCCLLTLEAVGDDLFFGAGGTMAKGIWRADAYGSNKQFLHGSPQPLDLAYDPVENKVYAATVDGIFRMNADGTDFEEVELPPDNGGNQIEVDSRGRKLYWAQPNAKVIRRSDLDGSNVETFVTSVDAGNPNLNVRGLTIVDSPSVPALSDWGLTGMTLLILGAGLVVMRKRFKSKGAMDVQYPT